MKNKYVAIVLSIVAVIVVAYRIFLSGDKSKPAPTQSLPSAPIHDPMAKDPGTTQPGLTGDNEILIDIDPGQLLYPIDIQVKRYLKRQLPHQSKTLFQPVHQKERGDVGLSSPVTESEEVKYILYATILDEDRRIAVINRRICQVGDILEGGAEIKHITKGQVTLILEGQSINLLINPSIRKIYRLEGD